MARRRIGGSRRCHQSQSSACLLRAKTSMFIVSTVTTTTFGLRATTSMSSMSSSWLTRTFFNAITCTSLSGCVVAHMKLKAPPVMRTKARRRIRQPENRESIERSSYCAELSKCRPFSMCRVEPGRRALPDRKCGPRIAEPIKGVRSSSAPAPSSISYVADTGDRFPFKNFCTFGLLGRDECRDVLPPSFALATFGNGDSWSNNDW